MPPSATPTEPCVPGRTAAPRARGAPRRRIALLVAGLVTIAAIAPPTRAQDSVYHEQKHTSRSTTLGVTGVLIGGLAGLGIASSQSPPSYSIAVVGAVIGGAVGVFLGKQYDELHAAQYHGVRPITVHTTDAELEGDPAALAAHDSVVAVGGSEGVQLFISASSLVPHGTRAEGLLGIATVDIAPQSMWLTIGASHGLYVFPPERGRGSLVREGSDAAVVSAPDRVFAASGDRVIELPVDADSVAPWPGLDLGAPVRALALDSAGPVLWAVTDKQLIALRPGRDSIVQLGAAPIDGAARRVAVARGRVAVAVGEKGVRVFDGSDPASPRATHVWTVARFAYDVSLEGERMFVAAGPEGVYLAEFHGKNLATVGLARGLGFASAIVSRDGYTYLLDRRTNHLRRILSDLEVR